jgi:hypothetical protein
MKNKDVKSGMKVVPHSKSIGCSFEKSSVWEDALVRDQPYLYVSHMGDGAWLLSDQENDYAWDYFNAKDFEPYNA